MVKISTQLHTIVKQICFPSGNVFFLSLFSPSKNWMHNVVWGCPEILPTGLLLRGLPVLLSLVWLQTELDSTQPYYHYLLCTQRIKSDLRSAREIWTTLILWKITLTAAKSWFDSPSSEKEKVSPPTFSLLFSALKCSFRCLTFSV